MSEQYCFAEVNLSHYAHNLCEIKRYLPKSAKIMAVIKANAYGCGIVEIAKKAVECGIYSLGVARIDEALIVRKALPQAKILILGYTPKELLKSAIAHNIELCVYHREIAEAISREAIKQGKIAQIHIKIDTGMGRIGYLCDSNSPLELHSVDLANFGRSQTISLASRLKFAKNHESQTKNPSVVLNAESTESSLRGRITDSPKQSTKNKRLVDSSPTAKNNEISIKSNADFALNEITQISQLKNIQIAGIFTHFSSADEENLSYTKMQCDRYSAFIKRLEMRGIRGFIRHCANSAGIFSYPQSVFDMVRVGIVSYGINPFLNVALPISLKPVLSLKARVVHIKTLPKDSAVSYGRTFITNAPTKIATISVGYADGYSRLLSNKAEVLIRGIRAKVVGNVCMDQICVDISEIERVEIGDCAVLFGVDECGNEISADELAQKIGTISYEVICAVSNRVHRVYKG